MMLSEHACDLGQHAGMVLGVDPHVEAAIGFGMIARGDAGLAVRPQLECAECDGSTPDRGIDEICNDRRSSRHLAGAATVEHELADGVAHDTDRVEGPADIGEWTTAFNERR